MGDRVWGGSVGPSHMVENERPPSDIFGRCMKHDANRVNLQPMRARARVRTASEKLNFLTAIAYQKYALAWQEHGKSSLEMVSAPGGRGTLRRGGGNMSRYSHPGRGATVRLGAADLLFGRWRFRDASAAAPRGCIHIEKLAAAVLAFGIASHIIQGCTKCRGGVCTRDACLRLRPCRTRSRWPVTPSERALSPPPPPSPPFSRSCSKEEKQSSSHALDDTRMQLDVL